MKKQFTLIELILVIAILGILAGLLIPQISQTRRTANMAATASNQARVANLIQTHFATNLSYPNYMDNLLMGEANSPSLYVEDINGSSTIQSYGLPKSGPDLWKALSVAKFEGNYLRSLTRSGITHLFQHDVTRTDLNANENAITRIIVTSPLYLATLDLDGAAGISQKAVNFTITENLLGDLFGEQGPPRNSRIIALGFGAKNSSLGNTALQAPIYPGCDGTYYGRFIVLYCIYADGRRATLAGVIDSYGRTYNYTMKQISESMPSGMRRD